MDSLPTYLSWLSLSNWKFTGDSEKNVKNRNPEDYEKLKQYCIEEWNKINPKNYLKNFLKRVKMVLKINGNRLEERHLKQIRKEEKEDEEEGKKIS